MRTRTPARAKRDFEIAGKLYQIDMTHEYIKVYEIKERPDTSVLARAIAEAFGKSLVRRAYFEIDDKVRSAIILAAGWKFSRSRRWQDTWQHIENKRRRATRQGVLLSWRKNV